MRSSHCFRQARLFRAPFHNVLIRLLTGQPPGSGVWSVLRCVARSLVSALEHGLSDAQLPCLRRQVP